MTNTLLTAAALSLACALLSVIVVLRRWAFIGEGIAHSGFGGAGAAWLLMLAIPALDQPWLPHVSVVVFCLLTALAIGALSREGGIGADAAIGIFLTASLAFGIVAQQLYVSVRHTQPPLFDNLLFGSFTTLSSTYTQAAIAVCLLTVAVVALLGRQIIAYSFSPTLARASGVPTNAIHHLLLVLLALVIVVGMRIAGSVLVTALLVLPGTTALRLSDRLRSVLMIAVIVALIGGVGGVLLSRLHSALPAGPIIVLVLLLEFIAAAIFASIRGRAEP